MTTISSETISKWAKDQAIDLNCSIRKSDHGTGLFFLASSRNETSDPVQLVKVPGNVVLSRSTVIKLSETNEFLKDLLFRDATGSKLDKVVISNKDVFYRFFIFEILSIRRGTPDQNYSIWIEHLPASRDIKLPISWEKEEVDALYETSIYEATIAKINFLKYRYKQFFDNLEVRELIKDYVTSGSAALKRDIDKEITFYDWILIEEWISSRSLEIWDSQDTELESASSLVLGLVPVIDFCNHSGQANAKFELDKDTGDVLLVQTADTVEKDQEIFIDYGPEKGASEILFNYGFIPDNYKTARSATFGLPDVGEEDEEQTADSTADDEESQLLTVLKVKNRMFGGRPKLIRFYQIDDDEKSLLWDSEFIWLMSIPPPVLSIVPPTESSSTPTFGLRFQSGSNLLEYALDLDNIKQSIDNVDDPEVGEMFRSDVKAVSQGLVGSFIGDLLKDYDNIKDQEDSNKHQDSDQDANELALRLRWLEFLLLRKWN